MFVCVCACYDDESLIHGYFQILYQKPFCLKIYLKVVLHLQKFRLAPSALAMCACSVAREQVHKGSAKVAKQNYCGGGRP